MSDLLAILRDVVRRESAQRPGLTTSRVESVDDTGGAQVNIRSAPDNVAARPMGTTDVAPTDTMLTVHLEGLGAPLLWQRAPVDCGGAGAPVVDV